MKETFAVKIAGAAGQGIKTTGLLFAKSAKLMGFHVFGYTEYPSLIRGGHNIFQVNLSNDDVNAPSLEINAIVALNKESITLHTSELQQNSVIVFDNAICKCSEEEMKDLSSKFLMIDIPYRQITKEAGGSVVMENTTALGALWGMLGFDITVLESQISVIFQRKPEVAKINVAVAKEGYQSAQDKYQKMTTVPEPDDDLKDNLLITGNEALALGAIASGVRMYSAYPMTPSTSILHYLAEHAERTGMLVKQAEDEITAVQMALGANFSGTRAMTGTSGGGFALMTESIGYSAIAEIPLVVVVAQRTGPATGMPTWTEQGDLSFVAHAAPGDFLRIILAPGDPSEAFELTSKAHNLAEKYQLPVFILMDKHISEGTYTNKQFDQTVISIDRGKVATDKELAGDPAFLRYKYTEDGISPRSFPLQKSGEYLANSDEHDEKGYSTEDLDVRTMMVDKREAKYPYLLEEMPEPELIGEGNADLTFVSWGSTKGVLLDAIRILKKDGVNINALHYSHILPLRTEKLTEMISRGKRLINIENNASGQFARLIKEKIGYTFPENLLKYNGTHFFIEEIVQEVKDRI